jgi:diacylglycerol kinase (ATP)
MKYVFIINPKSGMTTVQKNVFKVIHSLEEEGHLVTVFTTIAEGDALEFAKGVTDCDLLVAVGGDGTTNEVVNGLLNRLEDQTIPLAAIPAGTVNDFANYFKLPNNEDQIYLYLTEFETKNVDIGIANDRYFTNVVASGFISDVGYKVQRHHKRRWGRFAYYFEGFKEAIRYLSHTNKFTFTIGDHEVSLDAYMFLAMNTTHLGGLSYFAPNATCDDGLIDLFIIKKTGVLGGLILLLEILMGRHIDDKNVIYFKVKSFSVDTDTHLAVDIDGEHGGSLPFNVRVKKQGLLLAIPKD